jgi:DNA-binding XRE family transcriptional regulator
MVDDKDRNSNPKLPTLRQVRERLNMTQEEFARELGQHPEQSGVTKEGNTNSGLL